MEEYSLTSSLREPREYVCKPMAGDGIGLGYSFIMILASPLTDYKHLLIWIIPRSKFLI
jgi:hypothetical protein